MFDKILIRYGELTLKGDNKKDFIKKLKENLLYFIDKKEISIEYDRAFIEYNEYNIKILQHIFGIFSYSLVIQTTNELKDIETQIQNYINTKNNIKTFGIFSRRNLKTFPLNSIELNQYFGNFVSKLLPKAKVDLNNPEIKINIEVRKNATYIFFDKIKTLGGMPCGSAGKVLHMMSGGIDSPVAAHLLQKRGLKVFFLNFITPPHTDEKTTNKTKELIEKLVDYQTSATLYQINFTDIMNLLSLTSNQKYKIILMRRSFYRIAEKIAQKNKFLALSNGESLGQVASQTLESINVISSGINLPILRPLISFDKIDIIDISQKIGTYNISIEKACETCELFAPRNPITKPHLFEVEKLEKELPQLVELENQVIEKMEIFKFESKLKK
ncbi:thiamine biosynthesis protein ThiI [Metamycoplasma hyosynoviae]|uniref:Probable tRNA sulfurtransferase n=1 Tax=Metamycoplasma hyosynoviae TaxID=29559 RepID=A0A4P1QFP5_9BACT|nr:tRNA uracil 4-sulfurtransferase ThiI [Metamycoplasma hyosynoviae]ASI53643.1 thiamine biosynthesis protein ThiI [Metamycoplasma hyosynoviae]MDC8920804.1 tRNA 4-thiouridine(8) synthase ThiI [Metamycoplasma hyosynoviae]